MKPTLRSLQKENARLRAEIEAQRVSVTAQTTPAEFAGKIKCLRYRRGNITSQAIAAALRMSHDQYLAFEDSEMDLELSTLQKLAGVLRITITIKP